MQITLQEWLTADASAAHEQYPQYRGHWHGWDIGVVRHKVETKLGLAFEAGDLVLLRPRTRLWFGLRDTDVTAYSWRNGIDTRLAYGDVVRLGHWWGSMTVREV